MDLNELRQKLFQGLAIPAQPLALTEDRKLDERRQKALTRYYVASGSGGLAVGVHSTQFAIRDPNIGLFQPVLELAASVVKEAEKKPLLISGVCGLTKQAVSEAETAIKLGYDAGLVSLSAFKDADETTMIEHIKAIAEIMPVIGFYLQPAAGGRVLPYSFWCKFAEIANVVAVKIAPFNRYQTLDVVRAVMNSGRTGEIALYTGNDDNIVFDLVTTFRANSKIAHIVGGLLGQFAVGTHRAVQIVERAKRWREEGSIPMEASTIAVEYTDLNAALFDPANGFAGCIPGINEMLRIQGLMKGIWTLDPNETLSPGQAEEIARTHKAYPHLLDDAFISENIDKWMS